MTTDAESLQVCFSVTTYLYIYMIYFIDDATIFLLIETTIFEKLYNIYTLETYSDTTVDLFV